MAFVYTGEQVDLGFGRGWMNRPAAESLKRIDAQIGHPLQVTEAGRTWDQQNVFYQKYLNGEGALALDPNTPSLHQVGNAMDTDEGQGIIGILEDNGWRRTVYRWINGVWTLVETWHFEYFPDLDNHRNDPEDDMQQDEREALFFIRQVLVETQQWQGIDTRVTLIRDTVNNIWAALTETQAWTGIDTRVTQIKALVGEVQAAVASGFASDAGRDAGLLAAIQALAAGNGADPTALAKIVSDAANAGAAAALATADIPTAEQIAAAVTSDAEKARLAFLEAEIKRLRTPEPSATSPAPAAQ